MIEVKSQDKNEILPESPNLAPTITATNGGMIMASRDKIPASKFGSRCSVPKPIRAVSGVFIIGENRVDTTNSISSSGNPGATKIETTRKTAFNPK